MTDVIVLSLLNAAVWACVIAMVSLGLTLIYGQLNIINIAHGAMYAIGAVSTFYITTFLGSWAYSLVFVPLIMAIIAIVIYLTTLRFRIVGYPMATTLIISYGLMFILEQALLLIFGGAPRNIPNPLPFQVPLMGKTTYSGYRIFAALFSLAAIGTLIAFLKKTKLGLWIRATSQDHDTASAMGISVPLVYMFTFVLGSVLAAVGGVLVAPMTSITSNMGHDILIDAFIVVIVGGFGSIPGTILAALILSLSNGLLSVFLDPVLAKGMSLAIMVGILYWRPEGILRY